MQGLTDTAGLTAQQTSVAGTIQKQIALTTVSAASVTLPANSFIQRIIIKNNTANAVTGGIKFGTTAGAVDVMAALAVGANALVSDIGTGLLQSVFSLTATQQIFFDAVVAWNNASVDVRVIYVQLT